MLSCPVKIRVSRPLLINRRLTFLININSINRRCDSNHAPLQKKWSEDSCGALHFTRVLEQPKSQARYKLRLISNETNIKVWKIHIIKLGELNDFFFNVTGHKQKLLYYIVQFQETRNRRKDPLRGPGVESAIPSQHGKGTNIY